MEMSKKEFGERIKRLRENNNLTQKELANALGITQSALSKYEKGERLIKLQFIKRLSVRFRKGNCKLYIADMQKRL